ncbi:hypothetical protein E5676_scaffold244G00430 [Cucumis melo var. makuwa]|uniref:Ty3-gypsy retrotransposon protein n=1 Tax=Cucumis melo var. makuwa TaxID=1194695 RepID=A0A5D3DU92_CUCMM|nr:hypothetical protein E5676_scaffold244G00430 [Cucumis melo var. makuwa]
MRPSQSSYGAAYEPILPCKLCNPSTRAATSFSGACQTISALVKPTFLSIQAILSRTPIFWSFPLFLRAPSTFLLLHRLPHAKPPQPRIHPPSFAHVSTSVPISDLLSVTSSVVLRRPHERFLLHPTGRTSPTENHPSATASDRPSGFRVHDQPSAVSASVDPLSVDSIEGHKQVSGKRFPTTGPQIEAGKVVIHRGLHVSNVTASCSLCAIGCKELFTDRHRCPDVLYIIVMLMGYVVDWNCMLMDFKILRLGVSFGITILICASFGITKLICATFGITRLKCASFGITRLIGKGTARGRPTRGKKDA